MANKKPPRGRPVKDTETAVLAKSARRCALCFHITGDLAEKIGQIAHLDSDPSNSVEHNLAWMCLPHHSLFDSKTSQHKNYTISEVKEARDRLYALVAAGRFFQVVPVQPAQPSLPSDAALEGCPMLMVREAGVAQFAGFELIARSGDAFEIQIEQLVCGDVKLAWIPARAMLLQGERTEVIVQESGHPVGTRFGVSSIAIVALAMERLVSPENPTAERAFRITYRDVARRLWQTEYPIRYDKRTGKVELLAPRFSQWNSVTAPKQSGARTEETSGTRTGGPLLILKDGGRGITLVNRGEPAFQVRISSISNGRQIAEFQPLPQVVDGAPEHLAVPIVSSLDPHYTAGSFRDAVAYEPDKASFHVLYRGYHDVADTRANYTISASYLGTIEITFVGLGDLPPSA
jgi:hypothetical protein